MQRACQAAYTDGPTSCSAATPRRTDLLLPYMRPDGRPSTEDDLADPRDLVGAYKRSKWRAEQVAMAFHRRGLDLVVVNPSTPVGAGDVKPTPTGRILLDFLLGRMPAYVDTGLNLIAVRDVAAGHLLALERGRSGQRYILGHANLTLAELLGRLATVTGRKAPWVRLPHWAGVVAAAADELIAAPLLGRAPRAPLDGARMARKRMFFDARKAVEALALPQTPIDAALSEAARWFEENGYLAAPRVGAPRRLWT